VRQHQVEQEEVGLAPLDSIERFGSIGRLFDGKAFLGEIVANQLANIALVLNHQNFMPDPLAT
jgi:hypothetical protein